MRPTLLTSSGDNSARYLALQAPGRGQDNQPGQAAAGEEEEGAHGGARGERAGCAGWEGEVGSR